MFFTGNAKLPQANWFFQRDSSICLRLFALDGEITHLPQAIGCRLSNPSVRLRLFLVSRIERIYILKLWSFDDLNFLSAWGFISYHILKVYMFWSDEVSTNWFFCTPKAFFVSRIERIHVLKRWSVDELIFSSAWGFFDITYWRDTYPKAMERRRVDSSVYLRLFCVSRIEGILIRRGMDVGGRRCAAALGWRWQNEKRSRMRLSSDSLRFSRRHRGALCTV